MNNNNSSNAPVIPHTMITTAVRGHLASPDFPSEYGWSVCAPLQLFTAPINTIYKDDMLSLKQTLTDQSRNVQALILWLDCDREGEAIGDEVRQVCIESNTNLCIKRARFSTVLAGEIKRSLYNLDVVNENFVEAVKARTELDLRVGASFTRFQTLRLQKRFEIQNNNGNQSNQVSNVISYGPCQFPTLGFVVERWARIETFIPEEFWFLEMRIKFASGSDMRTLTLSWKRQRLYDRICTLVIYESCLDEEEAVVKSVTGRPKNKWRPVPLATVELQKRASKYLRIGSEQLMSAAEELYQQGFISYPRTETERFQPEFEHRPLIESFTTIDGTDDIVSYANKLTSDGNHFQLPRAGPNNDNAHPPITPARAVNPNTINDPIQRNVYILVVKHYLACCSRDAIGKETELVVKMATEEFIAKGLMIVERNWLEIYHPWERWSTGQGEIPRLEVGSRVRPASLLMKDGRTTAPLPLSEVELISLMDRNGIGTDATIAQHIGTIQDRNYATKDAQQRFNPTKLGIALIEGYNSMGYQLNKPDLRRETEHECNAVALGQKTKDQIMAPILEKMRQCFLHVNAEAHKLDDAVRRHFAPLGSSTTAYRIVQPQRFFGQCGSCGQSNLILKQLINSDRRKLVLYCPTCALGHSLPSRGEVSLHTENNSNNPVLCPICQFPVLQISRGEGYTGNGYKLCVKCFNDSPQEYGGTNSGTDFRCFECTHPTCSLAGGVIGSDITIFSCPFCGSDNNGVGGKVMFKRTSNGRFILSCDKCVNSDASSCRYTIWLPREASDITIPEVSTNNSSSHQGQQHPQEQLSQYDCANCSNTNNQQRVRKLKFVWKAGSVPPHVEREHIGCVLCDRFLKEDMRIQLPIRNNQVRIHNRGGARGGRSRGRGRGRARNGGRYGQ